MSLFLREGELATRSAIAASTLQPLARSLAADLEPLLSRDIYFPEKKALLSREGGRCARDGTLLEFDPFQPHEHRCPKCGEVYRGDLHDRFWIYWYQLWLAERAVHAAVLNALGVDDRFATLATTILDGYVERYLAYPNVDNVLGPTRLFFSTYLESIWLMQICAATSLLPASLRNLGDRVRDRIIEPSRAIIAEYDERGSNRQVWNDAALLAAARMVDDAGAAESAVFGPSGIVSHLTTGLLPDGTWFEGENYHLFAHRGLWYGVTMAATAGIELPSALLERFNRGFATPFATALPDFTLPSRRDSQYAISLRQWRIAEHCELGVTRNADPVVLGALQRMYGDDVPRVDTGRSRSSADAERNGPPSALSRADLSWRALLCARDVLPPLEPASPGSTLLDAQGIAVFRRNQGKSYVALDYGHSGGGHGHPDRLNVLLADGATRWLDDYGTGSYVDPSLHWYRSTLAHNAPLIGGTSQRRIDGTLIAYDERGAAGWIVADAKGIAPGAACRRTLVVMSEYIIDSLDWTAADAASCDLPFHADLAVLSGTDAVRPGRLLGSDGTEDGFRFAHDATVQFALANAPIHAEARDVKGQVLSLWSRSDRDTEWWRAIAAGPPSTGERAFRVIRATAATGRYQTVLAWSDDVISAEITDDIRVTMKDGCVHVHRRDDAGWHIELLVGKSRSGIDLGGVLAVPPSDDTLRVEAVARTAIVLARSGEAVTLELGQANYRRSEHSWREAGEPAGQVTLAWIDDALQLRIDVARSDRSFAAAGAENLYDNEHPDINGDGVQLYVRSDEGTSAWMLVPERESGVLRVRVLEQGIARATGTGTNANPPATLSGSWQVSGDGYRIDVTISGIIPRAVDVVVNEMPRGRERRRGQLVLSGAVGEFVYLQGDRHDPNRLIPLNLSDA
ncbi:MAG TPA: heparinase II/III family protein [Gemmatimonadaceae bacterium]|nr:heparinase II/III family protein [Gemmatimonadaceae bacterium]